MQERRRRLCLAFHQARGRADSAMARWSVIIKKVGVPQSNRWDRARSESSSYPGEGDRELWPAYRAASEQFFTEIVAAHDIEEQLEKVDYLQQVVPFVGPTAQATTDADGRFTVSLRRGQRYVVVARPAMPTGKLEFVNWEF